MRKILLLNIILTIPSLVYFSILFINRGITADVTILSYIYTVVSTLGYINVLLFLLIVILAIHTYITNKSTPITIKNSVLLSIILYFNLFSIKSYDCICIYDCVMWRYLYGLYS